MSFIDRDLVFLILQCLDEKKFKESVRKLEQESGLFFNMKYFEEAVLAGDWEDVERYLSAFTKLGDGPYSMKAFFEIRKQKYLEALDRHDKDKALDILRKDLKVFNSFNKDLFKDLTLLVPLENFRQSDQLSAYGDIQSARLETLDELKKVIKANPLLRDKLHFPPMETSRLTTLLNQSLNLQHHFCTNPNPNVKIKSLFVDHSCPQPYDAPVPFPSPPLVNVMPQPGAFSGLPFQQAAAVPPTSFAGWMANSVPHPAFFGAPFGCLAATPHPAPLLTHPVTDPNVNPALHYYTPHPAHVINRPHHTGIDKEIGQPTAHLSIGSSGIAQSQHAPDELPKTVASQHALDVDELPETDAMTLSQGSTVTSVDLKGKQPIQEKD